MTLEVISLDEVNKLKEPEPSFVSDVEMFDCVHCGTCPDPEHCVWSVVCPECLAQPSEQCTAQGGRLVGLHDERWRIAKRR